MAQQYVLSGSATATEMFNQRTVNQDAAVIVPHLRPGMRLVDFGCGAGSLTCDFAAVVEPGDVVGFDMSEPAISRARTLAEQSGLSNVQFSVANIYDLELPAESFDVAHFCGVLMYLKEPDRALRLAFQSLKSGGMLAAREAVGGNWFGQTGGSWFAGPCADSIALAISVAADWQKASGSDPSIGRRLRGLLREAGFERLEATPNYSAALSNVTALATTMLSIVGRPDIRASAIQSGVTAERFDRLADEISTWAASEDSIAAVAECTVIGWKS
jgi:ubiquinone/menaquinone biosynthesis C-methylase UbiE